MDVSYPQVYDFLNCLEISPYYDTECIPKQQLGSATIKEQLSCLNYMVKLLQTDNNTTKVYKSIKTDDYSLFDAIKLCLL